MSVQTSYIYLMITCRHQFLPKHLKNEKGYNYIRFKFSYNQCISWLYVDTISFFQHINELPIHYPHSNIFTYFTYS